MQYEVDAAATATASSGNVSTFVPAAPLPVPKFGEWPYFPAPTWLRNGREAGCWLVGIISVIPEKCAHVWLPEAYVAGATHAMIEGNLQVKPYSFDGEQGGTTLEVRHCAWEFEG